MIYITKPNHDLQLHEGKCNMQLYELQVFRDIIVDKLHTNAKIIGLNELINCKRKVPAIIFCFVGKYNDSINDLIRYCNELQKVHLIIIGNDPRLQFTVRVDEIKCKITYLVNASTNAELYRKLTIHADNDIRNKFNIVPAELWSVPGFYLKNANSKREKFYDMAFYCIHYTDLTDYRKKAVEKLVDIAKVTGNRLLLFGADYPKEFNVPPIIIKPTIDAKELTETLSCSRTVPVLLEELHEICGCLTSRIAEAICSNSIPYIVVDYEVFPSNYLKFRHGNVNEFVEYLSKKQVIEPDNIELTTLHMYLDTAMKSLVDTIRILIYETVLDF